ncbi:MAG: RidA family protein [Rhizobiaceae bacterium]
MKFIDKGPRMSQAVAGSGIVATAGQVGAGEEGVDAQTKLILKNIDRLLSECNSDKSRILYATIWLTDMANYDLFNAVWDKWIDPGCPPARACVTSELAKPDWLVEVQVFALTRD